MNLNRLTERSQDALREAQGLATRAGNQGVDVEHLMLALLAAAATASPAPLLQARAPIRPPCRPACSRRSSACRR